MKHCLHFFLMGRRSPRPKNSTAITLGRCNAGKKKIGFSSLSPSTFCYPFIIVFSSTVCIFHRLFWAQKDHTAHFMQPKENNSAVWKKGNVELESAFPIAELQSKHWSSSGQCSRVSTFHVSRALTLKCRIRPTNQQTFCSKECSLQTSPDAAKNSRWLYLPALSMSQEWRGGFCKPGSRGAPAPLLANEAPCPSADYESLLAAHRAYFMHCLQETPPGNLYLQGWQTAISSITGWLRETEPIKWILESTGVFTSVPSKGEEKKNHCNVECTAHFRKEVHVLCRTRCFSKRCPSKHEQQEA